MKKIKDKKILNVEDVAKYLDVHPMTVYRYAKSGKIPAFKIGTDWRFTKESFEKWIKEKEAYHFKSARGRRKTDIKILRVDRRKRSSR